MGWLAVVLAWGLGAFGAAQAQGVAQGVAQAVSQPAAQMVARTFEAAPRWAASPGFERPVGLAEEIGFWVRIYSQVTTQGGLIHDDRHLAVVYEQLDFPERSSNAERLRLVDRTRARHAAALRSLAARLRTLPEGAVPDPGSLPPDELVVLEAWPGGTTA
ncbi:MAG: hypothetical protein RJB26_2095, partial [Pseudomonadota bacterium]